MKSTSQNHFKGGLMRVHNIRFVEKNKKKNQCPILSWCFSENDQFGTL